MQALPLTGLDEQNRLQAKSALVTCRSLERRWLLRLLLRPFLRLFLRPFLRLFLRPRHASAPADGPVPAWPGPSETKQRGTPGRFLTRIETGACPEPLPRRFQRQRQRPPPLLVWPRVILFGDSITQFSFQENGWGASLAERLVRKCDVVNRGLSGYNTRWAKLILPRLISKSTGAESTVAVTIFFGANDSALKDLNPKQHVPLEEYAANLKSMIQYLKSVDVTEDRILLITPPPLQESAWEKECLAKGDKLNRRNATTGEYAQACVQVARDCGTDVLDLWTLMQKNQDFSSYLSDGLHLSTKGNSFLAAQLWSHLENKLSALPSLLPYWRDVDHTNPEASLL
ncbi:PREDICTED: isoamyl acetate-hydrolyzing esterase 1 homolog [Nipponia nippon]|nr:PREDICTED: isoamyl acetate-hydrolyzing esterase 1 homolog [Nipponia nippon]